MAASNPSLCWPMLVILSGMDPVTLAAVSQLVSSGRWEVVRDLLRRGEPRKGHLGTRGSERCPGPSDGRPRDHHCAEILSMRLEQYLSAARRQKSNAMRALQGIVRL